MSDLQMPRIKKLKMFRIFVSMATELPDHQKFYKNTAISKEIILLLQTKICITYSHSCKVSKGAQIRNRYNQVPHLTQDTNGDMSFN